MASIQGTSIGAKIVPFDTADTYPTHEDFYGQGGYVVGDTLSFIALTGGAIPPDRRKIGQIIYLPSINKHYTFNTLNSPISAYDLKPALPFEYAGSVISTNFVAKTNSVSDRNIISSALGYSNGGSSWTREMFEHCSILGGSENLFNKDVNAFYLGTNTHSTIVGGNKNRIDYANFSTIGGGQQNRLQHNHNVIAGGRENLNYAYNGSVVGGGFKNELNANGQYSVIAGGRENKLGAAQANYSSIGGGYLNSLAGDFSSIVGGNQNTIFGTYNFVGGGQQNSAGGSGDVIVGGKNNLTSSANIAQLTLLTVSYSALQIDPKFVLDTYVRVIDSKIFEFIPGASDTQTAQGVVRILPLNDTAQGNTTPRVPAVTLYSPTPTVSGRFGHFYFVSTSNSATSGHMFISEPGANKVHLYRINYANISQQPSLITTIVPPETIPLSAQFGISFTYIDAIGSRSYLYNNTEAYNLLIIGAPGVDKAYVFTNNVNLYNFNPNTPSTVFSFISALTGQPNSEFGYSLDAGCSYDNSTSTGYFHPSSIHILVGAPNYNRAIFSPNERTGAFRLYITQPAADYSPSNRRFKPFYHATDVVNYGPAITNWWSTSTILPGDRFGSNINGVFDYFPSGTANLQLSSYSIFFRTNIPSANVKRVVKLGPNPNQIKYNTDEFWTNTRDLNTTWPAFSGSFVNIVSGAGVAYQFYISGGQLSNYNEQKWEIQPYLDWSIFSSYSLWDSTAYIEGPGGTTTDIYSISGFLSATNWQLDEAYTSTRAKNVYYPRSLPGGGQVNNYPYKFACNNPRTLNNYTNPISRYPGICYTIYYDARGMVLYIPPYPAGLSLDTISNYGFQNFRTTTTDNKPGFSTIYYLSGNTLTYTNFAADIPGEGTSTNTILGGQANTMRGKTSLIGGGTNNLIDTNVTRSAILAGGSNSISTPFGSLLTKSFNLIGTGLNNRINNSDYSNILNGSDNTIQADCIHTGILGGTQNTILSGLSGVFVLGSSLSGTKSFTTYVNNLFASDHIQAKTKSFTIKHPIKDGKTLTYGSLESPYHGIRLTGTGKVVKGECVVSLPDYTNKLVKSKDINIQLTNLRHSKVLYVDNINLSKNNFTVKTDSILSKVFDYEFFWTFTAIRTDVPEIIVES